MLLRVPELLISEKLANMRRSAPAVEEENLSHDARKIASQSLPYQGRECARAALTATEHDIKAIYQDLAMQWRELAVRAADLEDSMKHHRQSLALAP